MANPIYADKIKPSHLHWVASNFALIIQAWSQLDDCDADESTKLDAFLAQVCLDIGVSLYDYRSDGRSDDLC